MNLIKNFYVDGSRPYTSMGSNIPPWNSNYLNVASWYKNDDYNFFYNIVNNEDVYVQYGQDVSGWASARFLKQTLEIISEVTNSDGSITATIEVQSDFFKGSPNLVGSVSWAVNYDVKINNVSQYNFNALSRDAFEYGQRPKLTFDINVPPQQTNTQGAFLISITYPNGEAPDNIFTVGFGLFNPNPISYVPMSIRKSSNWKDLDTNNGKILIRKASGWINKSNENASTSKQVDKGNNRIRINNQWRQLPKMEGGTSI